jgi:hypothetical protein
MVKKLHSSRPISHNFRISFETIEDLLKDNYLVLDTNLTLQEDGTLIADKIVKFQGDVTSKRSQLMYKSAMEI